MGIFDFLKKKDGDSAPASQAPAAAATVAPSQTAPATGDTKPASQKEADKGKNVCEFC